MVAKSYQKYELISKPFEENGKEYVLIDFHNKEKKVRWYPEPYEKIRTLSSVLGFDKGFIWIFKGYNDSFAEWFKSCPQTRYHVSFGWYVISTDAVPELPAGVEAVKLLKENTFKDDEHLLPKEEIEKAVQKLIYKESNSTYQGSIGDKIEVRVQVAKITDLGSGTYGLQSFYLFKDKDENAYCWFTAPKNLELGKWYELKGKIKKLQVYKGEQQTVLTNCRTKEMPQIEV